MIEKDQAQQIFSIYEHLHQGNGIEPPLLGGREKKVYAVTNFRGGIGKTTLSFNIAYQMSGDAFTLYFDVCPQQNFTELLSSRKKCGECGSVFDMFMMQMMGDAWTNEKKSSFSLRVSDYNDAFKGRKSCYFVPGSNHLFLFPSQLYSRLNEYFAMTSGVKNRAVEQVLNMLSNCIKSEMDDSKADKVLIDTSPFFAGGTHLAWMAADALIIPVRVDEQSIYSLELTLSMLNDDESDFNLWRKRASIDKKPTVQAILMTHCGWNRQAQHQLDSASRLYIERAVEISHKYRSVFSTDEPYRHFALLSDFHSSGRISGSKAIPIELLKAGQSFTVEQRKLEVNDSVERYKKELQYAYKIING